jgi:hypothetical protein
MTAITEDSIRCLYCVEQEHFRLMTARARGSWYLCSRCSHIAMPTYPNFQCGCANCIDQSRSKAQRRDRNVADTLTINSHAIPATSWNYSHRSPLPFSSEAATASGKRDTGHRRRCALVVVKWFGFEKRDPNEPPRTVTPWPLVCGR